MKTTQAIVALDRLIDENSRLRTKNRNYRLQLKQLTRAHILTLRLLEQAQAREEHSGNVKIEIAPQWYPEEPDCKVDAEITLDPR